MKRQFKIAVLSLAMAMLMGITAYAEGETSEAAIQSTTKANISKEGIKTSQETNFKYLFFTPENATENMPLIVYLHGAGTRGTDLNDLLEKDVFAQYLSKAGKSNVPAYVLMPQCDGTQWEKYKTSVLELIESTATDFKIDRNRISLLGLSMGGDYAIQIASEYPEIFSCIMPIVPFSPANPYAKFEDSQIDTLKNTPILFVYGSLDRGKSTSDTVIQKINNAGGKAELIELPEADHKIVSETLFQNGKSDPYALVNWLISKSK